MQEPAREEALSASIVSHELRDASRRSDFPRRLRWRLCSTEKCEGELGDCPACLREVVNIQVVWGTGMQATLSATIGCNGSLSYAGLKMSLLSLEAHGTSEGTGLR